MPTRYTEYRGVQIPVNANEEPMYVTQDKRNTRWSYTIPQGWQVPGGRGGKPRKRSRTFGDPWDAALHREELRQDHGHHGLNTDQRSPIHVPVSKRAGVSKLRRATKNAPPAETCSQFVQCHRCGAHKQVAAMCGFCSSGRSRRDFAYANNHHAATGQLREETEDDAPASQGFDDHQSQDQSGGPEEQEEVTALEVAEDFGGYRANVAVFQAEVVEDDEEQGGHEEAAPQLAVPMEPATAFEPVEEEVEVEASIAVPAAATVSASAAAPIPFIEKLKKLKFEMDIDVETPAVAAIGEANKIMGFSPSGTLAEQLDMLIQQLSKPPKAVESPNESC